MNSKPFSDFFQRVTVLSMGHPYRFDRSFLDQLVQGNTERLTLGFGNLQKFGVLLKFLDELIITVINLTPQKLPRFVPNPVFHETSVRLHTHGSPSAKLQENPVCRQPGWFWFQP